MRLPKSPTNVGLQLARDAAIALQSLSGMPGKVLIPGSLIDGTGAELVVANAYGIVKRLLELVSSIGSQN